MPAPRISYVASLPPEPPVGAIAWITSGDYTGFRYRHETGSSDQWLNWVQIYPVPGDDMRQGWEDIWNNATTGGGTDGVTIHVPDPADPHPRPWACDEDGHIFDALGDWIGADAAVELANALHAPPPPEPQHGAIRYPRGDGSWKCACRIINPPDRTCCAFCCDHCGTARRSLREGRVDFSATHAERWLRNLAHTTSEEYACSNAHRLGVTAEFTFTHDDISEVLPALVAAASTAGVYSGWHVQLWPGESIGQSDGGLVTVDSPTVEGLRFTGEYLEYRNYTTDPAAVGIPAAVGMLEAIGEKAQSILILAGLTR
jgi:hypothetical protein